MFRPMRRFKQEVPEEECRKVLYSGRRGILSVLGDDGYPYGVPVNYVFDSDTDTIYVHGAKTGHKIESIKRYQKVCFTMCDEGYQNEGDWAWHVTSVVAMGEAVLIDDLGTVAAKMREMVQKYYPTQEEIDKKLKMPVDRVQMIAIHIQHLTGKLVCEK